MVASVVLAIALTGCGGGGGGSVGTGGQVTNPQTVDVSGTVTAGTGGPSSPVRLSPQTRAPGSTSFAGAKVRAVDYATGQEYVFSLSVFTDSAGHCHVLLPKGKDFILFFEKSLTGGGDRASFGGRPESVRRPGD